MLCHSWVAPKGPENPVWETQSLEEKVLKRGVTQGQNQLDLYMLRFIQVQLVFWLSHLSYLVFIQLVKNHVLSQIKGDHEAHMDGEK